MKAREEAGLQGSRDAIQLAYKRGLIADGERWMQMLKDRNRTSHTYNEDTANEIASHILETYFQLFITLRGEFQNQINNQGNLFDHAE